jgi:hypothetical protein
MKTLVFSLLAVVHCAAATWYVSTTGNNSAACTSTGTACATMNGAYQKSSAGDIIEMAAGTYVGIQNILYKSANSCANAICTHVTFQPASGATVILQDNLNFGNSRSEAGGSHITVKDITILDGIFLPGCGVADNTPCPSDANMPGADITFQNLRVKGLYSFTCSSCSYVTITGGTYGPDTYGCQAGNGSAHPEIQSAFTSTKRANHILIENSTWQNYARCTTADHTECLQVEPADDITLRGNVFKQCDTITINFANDLANSNSAAGFRAPNNVLIENNFFDTAKDATGGETFYALNIRECTNCIIRNNSWTQAPRLPTGEIALNVQFTGNAGPMESSACGVSGVTFRYNVWEGAQCHSTDTNVADVKFVNRSGVNLHLQPTSPAIDKGSPTDFPSIDIDLQSRISPADAGADEFSAGGAAAPTVTASSPTSITQTTATANSDVPTDGGATITERGACWGLAVNPSTGGTCLSTTGTTGPYTIAMFGMTPNTPYHYRAYAINSVGTGYSADVPFSTLASGPPAATVFTGKPVFSGNVFIK